MRPAQHAAPAPVPGDPDPAPDRPLLTYIDDATGERVELSPAQLGRWAARTASLLRQGCLLAPGDRAAVLLPPHWQTAAVLLGAWSAGITVSFRPWATAGLQQSEADASGALDALFVSSQRLDSWLEAVPAATHRFVLGLAADAVPLTEVPPGYLDYLTEIDRYPEQVPAYTALRPGDPASADGTTYEELSGLARGVAGSMGLRSGDRVLVDAAGQEQPIIWLLAPLLAGASIVICANLDRATLDARIAAEGVTRLI